MQAQKKGDFLDQEPPAINSGRSSAAEILSGGLTPEESLLVLAARLKLNEAESAAMAGILKNGPDWSVVKDQSGRLGVQPLLYKHLSREGLARFVPDEVLAVFQTAYHRQSIRSLRIHGQIIRISEAMNRANIPIILLKGAFLAKRLYEDIALRPMNDIDLVSRVEDTEVVRKVLQSLGYEQAIEGAHSKFHEQLSFTEIGRSNHLPAFLKPNAVRVEVHTDIFVKVPRRNREMNRVWKRAVVPEKDDQNLFCLSLEHQILHLSNHLYEHILSGSVVLPWFCDIHAWINRHETEIDWKELQDIAESLGIASRIAALFDLLVRHWKTPVPEPVVRSLDADFKPLSLKWAIFVKKTVSPDFVPSRIRLINDVREEFGWGKSAYFVFKHLFPDRSHMIKRYKPSSQHEITVCYIRHFLQKFRYAFWSLFLLIRKPFRS